VRLVCDAQGLTEIFNGELILLLAGVRVATVIEGANIIRPALDCMGEIFDSPIEITFAVVGDATVVESDSKARGGRGGRIVGTDRSHS
jgi:hypothetical protein